MQQVELSRGPYLVEYKYTLEFCGPVHVGTGQKRELTSDAPLLVRDDGSLWLPASSVRGVLRDWCEREMSILGVDGSAIDRLFGTTPRGSGDRDDRRVLAQNDRQGRLIVHDVIFDSVDAADREIRDFVCIDRDYGAAADGGKFDMEVYCARAATLLLRYEGDGPRDRELILLEDVRAALDERLLAFGAKSAAGFGVVRATAVQRADCNRQDVAQLAAYLKRRIGLGSDIEDSNERVSRHGESIVPLDPGRASDQPSRTSRHGSRDQRSRIVPRREPWSWLRMKVALQFDGPMLIADEYRGQDFSSVQAQVDHTYRVDVHGAPYLPGSSLRGAVRSHAERIAAHGSLLAVAARLFGWVHKDDSARGLVRFADCTLDGQLKVVPMNHVAIDRISGFSVEHKLFNACALASPRFVTDILVRWRIGVRRGQHSNEELAAVVLLLFALRDATQKQIWVGSRTTRGYGRLSGVEVREAKLSRVVADGQAGHARKVRTFALSDGPVASDAFFPWVQAQLADREFAAWLQLLNQDVEAA